MFERVGSGFPGLTPIYYNPRLGPGFIKRLLGEMNVTVSRDRRQATDWLASGKFALCIGCADVEHASKDGMPVSELDRRHLKEAGNGIGLNGNSGLALVSKAAHPHAATVFVNWFLSRRGQMVWQEVMNTKVEVTHTVSDLRYLPNRFWLPVAMRGSHWRRDSPRKPLPPTLGIPAPAQPPQ